MKHVPGAPFSKEIVQKSLEWMKSHWRENGFGHYVLIEKTSGKPVGVVNIRWEETPTPKQTLDLGYMVIQPFQGRGMAVEGIRPLLKLAFSELNASKVTAKTRKSNPESIRVLEKLGFASIGKIEQNNSIIGKQTYDLFEMSREAFQRQAKGEGGFIPVDGGKI
jgi:ribosomal-protein-alanine N-acetyltransferase